jgi:hypothetical protein
MIGLLKNLNINLIKKIIVLNCRQNAYVLLKDLQWHP